MIEEVEKHAARDCSEKHSLNAPKKRATSSETRIAYIEKNLSEVISQPEKPN